MQRKNFFKSLIALVAAPSVLGEINDNKTEEPMIDQAPKWAKEFKCHSTTAYTFHTFYQYDDGRQIHCLDHNQTTLT